MLILKYLIVMLIVIIMNFFSYIRGKVVGYKYVIFSLVSFKNILGYLFCLFL